MSQSQSHNIHYFLHSLSQIYYSDMDPKNAHLHGKGADIALLDSAYIMSEVISSFVFGIIVEVTDSTTSYITCSFVCGLLACYTFLKVRCAWCVELMKIEHPGTPCQRSSHPSFLESSLRLWIQPHLISPAHLSVGCQFVICWRYDLLDA